jgi:hypothetical protein
LDAEIVSEMLVSTSKSETLSKEHSICNHHFQNRGDVSGIVECTVEAAGVFGSDHIEGATHVDRTTGVTLLKNRLQVNVLFIERIGDAVVATGGAEEIAIEFSPGAEDVV